MEDDQTTAAAEAPPEAPPDGAPDALPDLGVVADESADIDAILADLRSQAEAEAEAPAEPKAEVPAEPSPDPATTGPDPAQVAEYLKAQGYTVEPPAPAPDPYAAYHERLVGLTGTDEAYAQARMKALAPIPPVPDDTDPRWQDKMDAHKAALAERDAAAADVSRMDTARAARDTAREVGWQQAMARLGQAWATLPETFALSPERAKRVTEPANATDAVAAIAEQITERYEARLAEREAYWKGEVARARSDRAAGAVRALGAAPQAGAIPGAKPASSLLSALFSGEGGLPSDDVIERAKRGELAGLSLE